MAVSVVIQLSKQFIGKVILFVAQSTFTLICFPVKHVLLMD